MRDFELQLRRLIAQQNLMLHHQLGDQFYHERRLEEAIEHYRHARKAAQLCEVEQAAHDFQRWIGICLFQLGRLKEAVIELAPFLAQGSGTTKNPDVIFHALIHYIQAAQRLPVRLATLESAYMQAEDLLRGSGKLSQRHEILVHRGRLELARGQLAAALATAQEAVALKDSAVNDFGQVWDFHYNGLVDICLLQSNGRTAAQYIEEWRHRIDEMPANREVRMACCVADLCRFEGSLAEAARWADLALGLALQTDYTEVRAAAFQSFVRCHLLLQDFAGARAALVKYAAIRRADSELERYSFYLLLGDFHLAHARCLARQVPHDDQFGKNWPGRIAAREDRGVERVRALGAARRCYRKASKIGTRVDAKLECDRRLVETERRRQELEGLSIQEAEDR